MAKHRRLNVQFPLGGLNRRGAYKQQPPYTTSDCLNVRASATIEGRERGGSRPGLIASHVTDIGSNVRMLEPMTLALGDGFTAWSDTFGGLSMATAWTQASWAAHLPSILPSALASVDTTIAEGEAVLSALTIDTSKDYAVEVFLTPLDGAYHGDYRLYLRLDDTTPDAEEDGVIVELVMTGSTGAYSGTLVSMVGGTATTYNLASGTLSVARPGWLTAKVSGNTITVYWCGVTLLTQAVSAHTGKRVGFGMECTVAGGVCLANVFRVQYYSTGSVDSLRSVLIASAGGNLYKESFYGTLAQVTSNLTVRSDVPLSAAQSGQKLYVADYGNLRSTGTDGTVAATLLTATAITDWTTLGIDAHDDVAVISNPLGTAVAGTYKISSVAAGGVTLTAAAGAGGCSYRIERAPKVYDPAAGTIVIFTATTGQVPTGCPLVCRYLDRIVLAGAEIAPHVWYMSRQGTPEDWDYSQTDSQRAVAGTSSDAGVPGDAITALVPHSDDYLVMACRNSLWRLRGDPAYGGSLDSLSRTVGIVGPNAWCLGPAGELVFLSLDGLYSLPPGGDSVPISLSRETLPQEFLNLDPASVTALLEYDVHGRGVHIYLTPATSNARLHWWLDWERKTFWPVSLYADHEPTATCALQSTAIEDSAVILGGRDGVLRRLSDLAENDCGQTFTTYAILGPIPLAPDSMNGTMLSMDAVMADDSGPVNWELRTSETFEGAVTAAADETGQWLEGLNATEHPAGRGQACALKLTGATGRRWAMESIVATVRESGRRRIE